MRKIKLSCKLTQKQLNQRKRIKNIEAKVRKLEKEKDILNKRCLKIEYKIIDLDDKIEELEQKRIDIQLA